MNDELRSLGSVRARGIMLLVVVALASGVAGGAIVRGFGWFTSGDDAPRTTPERRREEPAPFSEPTREERRAPGANDGIPMSLRSIDLTADQRTRIEQITAKYRPVADSLVRSIREQVQQLDLRMREEAMCVLTPKQRADWIAWRKRNNLSVEEGNEMLKIVNANQCPK